MKTSLFIAAFVAEILVLADSSHATTTTAGAFSLAAHTSTDSGPFTATDSDVGTGITSGDVYVESPINPEMHNSGASFGNSLGSIVTVGSAASVHLPGYGYGDASFTFTVSANTWARVHWLVQTVGMHGTVAYANYGFSGATEGSLLSGMVGGTHDTDEEEEAYEWLDDDGDAYIYLLASSSYTAITHADASADNYTFYHVNGSASLAIYLDQEPPPSLLVSSVVPEPAASLAMMPLAALLTRRRRN